MLTGGGSGGHITPILAVAAELKKLRPDIRIVYIGFKGDGLADIPKTDANIDEAYYIAAGKFRRYHGEGLKQLLDLPTFLKNCRDALRVLAGFWQSFWLLGRLRPSCIFVKGGFVGVPVGLGAALRHIPFVTHDSDALPGLANRLIARWASVHAVALPKELYRYPHEKTVTIGVPVHENYVPVDAALQAAYRREIGVEAAGKMVFLTGGGLGARRLNDVMLAGIPRLLECFNNLTIVLSVGRANEAVVKAFCQKNLSTAEQGRVRVYGYLSDLYKYSGAADVVVTRAGATIIAELAAQGKACIVVPNPQLSGGHQLKNADYLAHERAIALVSEATLAKRPTVLADAIMELLSRPAEQRTLAANLAKFAHLDAAHALAVILLEQMERGGQPTAE